MRRTAALVLVALLAGCGGGHHAPPHAGTPARNTQGDRPPSNRDQLQALLDRRARALERHDPSAYAATAAGVQRARDRRAASVASRLSLRDVRLQIRSSTVTTNHARLGVVSTWGIRGVRGTFVVERRLTAAHRPAGWRITGEDDRRGVPPWEAGDYAQTRIGHFVVLAPRALRIAASTLPAALAGGYSAIHRALPKLTLRRRYLVVVAPGASSARRLTQDIRGVEGLAAISDTAVHETGPAERVREVVSQRLLVLWPAFSQEDAQERGRVIAHELTHAVLAGSTSGRTPSWLVEGIAMLTSGDRRDTEVTAVLQGRAADGEQARREFSLRKLSTPDAIARLTGSRQAGAYAYASAATFALADRFGPRAVLRLYDAFNDESLPGQAGPRLVDAAMRRTLHEGLGAFEASLRAGLS